MLTAWDNATGKATAKTAGPEQAFVLNETEGSQRLRTVYNLKALIEKIRTQEVCLEGANSTTQPVRDYQRVTATGAVVPKNVPDDVVARCTEVPTPTDCPPDASPTAGGTTAGAAPSGSYSPNLEMSLYWNKDKFMEKIEKTVKKEEGKAGGENVQAQDVTLSEFALSPSTISLKEGKAKFAVKNNGSTKHTFNIVGIGEVAVEAGETKSLEVSLESGEYETNCTLPGHKEKGMKGTLKVG